MEHLKEILSDETYELFCRLPGSIETASPTPTADTPNTSTVLPLPPLSFKSATPTIDLPSTSAPPTPTENNATTTLHDAELELFVYAQKNVNTKQKTSSDLKKWYQWCSSVDELREIGDIPPAELDRLLGHFYCKVRKNDNSL